MSNHLAIATVTATLQRTLQVAVQKEFEGARVTTVSPSEVGKGTPETGINVFMYQVITNPALHNADVASGRSRRNAVKRQAALDLYYMLSCYGNNNELAPQRLLGSVVQTMNDKRVITQEMIQSACRDATLSFLQDSNLANQVQKINILPLDLNLEDLSKTWSVFFQTPYILSVAYKALVVMVDGRESLAHALPVRNRQGGRLSPFAAQPQIEQVIAQSGALDPIFSDSTVLIKGKQLKGYPRTQVRIGAIETLPTTVSPNQIELSLSTLSTPKLRAKLRAGIQTLQVIHPLTTITSGKPRNRRGPESNGVPFVLRPRIMQASASEVEEIEESRCHAAVRVQTDLNIAPQQKAVLSLFEWWPTTDDRWQQLQAKTIEPPATYLFEGTQREALVSTLEFSVDDITPGEYLVSVLIDGAESPLETDPTEWLDPATKHERNPQFDRYIGPRITIEIPE
ncbi:MAG: DUF4255 domain-containing protein [Cyanobacteria bacterium J06560_6]